MFQRSTSAKFTGLKSSLPLLKTQNLLRRTNPENFSSTEQILLNTSFLEGKITRFEKTRFELTLPEILKAKVQ